MFLTPWREFEEALEGFVPSRRGWRLNTDIWEDEHNIHLAMDLPGLKESEIKVEMHNETLTIAGERKVTKSGKDLHEERYVGAFERRFTVPENSVDAEKIAAKYRDGVLSLTLPKREQIKPRQIPISINQ